MPEIMPFGKYSGDSVEQIVLKDYRYFTYVFDNIELKKHSLRNRFNFVENVVNNFISQKICSLTECYNPASLISIYGNYHTGNYVSSIHHIYCSPDCFNNDPMADKHKTLLMPLKFRSALADTKYDTNQLVGIMAECIGLKSSRKTKEYLEDFFNRLKLKE